jgi:long-chain fatty acid transport protein
VLAIPDKKFVLIIKSGILLRLPCISIIRLKKLHNFTNCVGNNWRIGFMSKAFAVRKLVRLMCVVGIVGFSSNVLATSFQLWEQDGASIGDYHAGRAVTEDATSAYYNPAGLTHVSNQQVIIGDVGIMSQIKYRGTTSVSTATPFGVFPVFSTQNAFSVSQGGSFTQVPDLYYAAPLSKNFVFGLSVNVPYGLKTDYGRSTPLSFAATKSYIQVVDISPSIGFKVMDQLSIGAGFDIDRMSAELDQMATVGPDTSSYGTNKGWSTGYGYHLGVMYEPVAATRIGLSYNSQVTEHIRGNSRFVGPIANDALGIPLGEPATIYSGEANAHVTLPAYTTLSGFQKINSRWGVMGTVVYTQWSAIQTLTLQDIAAVTISPAFLPTPSTNTTVNLPTHWNNTWNVALGSEFYATDKITLRSGIGYDETPVKDAYRDVRIPDKNRFAIAFGGHIQATKTLGVDLGYTHLFMLGDAKINPPAEVTGAQVTTTSGKVNGSADIFGAQLTWDIA